MKKKRKKQRSASRATSSKPLMVEVTAGNAFANHIVGALENRGIFLTRPNNDGLPTGREPSLAQHAGALREAAALAPVPAPERNAVLSSLAATLRQAEYHRTRFKDFRNALDARRAAVPGDVVWDALGSYVHFELRAYTGAVRTSLDEMAYLIARRAGTSTKRARSAPWTTNELFTAQTDQTSSVPEATALTAHADWFDWLNAYRNSFYHHGWVSGSGHYDIQEGGLAARDPAMNALLVPDRTALKGKGKPFEWTWAENNTVDGLASRFQDGLQSLVTDIFHVAWGVPQPPPGTASDDTYPTMMVALPRPVYGLLGNEPFVPLFHSRDAAIRFAAGKANAHELRRLPVAEVAPGSRAIAFSTAGIETVLAPIQTKLYVLFDPAPFIEGNQLKCAEHHALDIAPILRDKYRMVCVPTQSNDVFMWATPTVFGDHT